MSDTDKLRSEVDRALARLALYEEVLTNIVHGYENAGRAEPISVQRYAAQALGVTVPLPPASPPS